MAKRNESVQFSRFKAVQTAIWIRIHVTEFKHIVFGGLCRYRRLIASRRASKIIGRGIRFGGNNPENSPLFRNQLRSGSNLAIGDIIAIKADQDGSGEGFQTGTVVSSSCISPNHPE